MIIWSGWGFLVLIIPFVVTFVIDVLANLVMRGYAAGHTWPMGLGLLISAVIVWLLGVKLEGPGRLLVDPATGQQVVLKKRHTFFWIPMKYFAFLYAAASLLFFLIPSKTAAPAGTEHASLVRAVSQREAR